jgi:hypothetical protein
LNISTSRNFSFFYGKIIKPKKNLKHIKNKNLNINQLPSKFVFRFWILFICIISSFSAFTQLFVNFESGALFTEINDIRNGNNGTLFSLKKDFQTSAIPFIRLRVGYISNSKNHFSFLYAPLKIIESGTLEKNILFEGKNFEANIPIETVYKFNSYRFTYNRRIIGKDNFKFGLGLSAKIRDAGISLKNKEFLRKISVLVLSLLSTY